MKKYFYGIVLMGCLAYASIAWPQEWKEFKRQHFIVYYKRAPFDFAESVEASAEEYYKEITEDLGFTRYKGWTWEDRAKIYIYDSADDYVESGKQAGWSQGATSVRDKVIRTFPSAHGFFDSVLPHELGHIIFREFVGFKAQIPDWFEEGLAMRQEKARRWGAHEAVREAMTKGTFIPLRELSMTKLGPGSSQEQVNLFYAEAASVVNFLITEYGEERFINLCRKLKDGRPFFWAVNAVYARFKTVDDLNNAWVDFLKKK